MSRIIFNFRDQEKERGSSCILVLPEGSEVSIGWIILNKSP